jgi:mRNA-degrading endonuclease toxin of MazEF toxin-antitoxin module
MADKPNVVARQKIRDRIGHLTEEQMAQVSAALTALLGL